MSVKNVVFPYHWEYGNSMEGDPASNAPKWAKWLAIASIMIPFVALAIFGMLPSSIVENISSEMAAVIFGVIAISMLVFLLVGLAICFGVQVSGSKKSKCE